MLAGLHGELAERRIHLLIAHDVGQVRDLLDQAGASELARHAQRTVDDAVTAARQHRVPAPPTPGTSPPPGSESPC
jgi:hypothetical protein